MEKGKKGSNTALNNKKRQWWEKLELYGEKAQEHHQKAERSKEREAKRSSKNSIDSLS